MKFLLASAMSIVLSTSVFCNVEDAIKLAHDRINIYESLLTSWEREGCRDNFHYRSGYADGSINAYKDILETLNKD